MNNDQELGRWSVTHNESGLNIVTAKTPGLILKQGDIAIADFYIFSFD